MRNLVYITSLLFWSVIQAAAQNPNALMRDGMLSYKKGEYAKSIEQYKSALAKKEANRTIGNYNLGAAYYKAGKADSALLYWQSLASEGLDKDVQARLWHNIGNSFVKQKNFEKAEDAYKRALKLNPNDEDTRYNLAYSQRRLQQQQQQQQKQEQEKQQQPKDQKEEEKKEEEKDKKEEQPKNNDKMSKEEAERMLRAMDNKEKNLHGRKKEVEGTPSNPQKDW